MWYLACIMSDARREGQPLWTINYLQFIIVHCAQIFTTNIYERIHIDSKYNKRQASYNISKELVHLIGQFSGEFKPIVSRDISSSHSRRWLTVLWNVALCRLVKIRRRFRGSYYLHQSVMLGWQTVCHDKGTSGPFVCVRMQPVQHIA